MTPTILLTALALCRLSVASQPLDSALQEVSSGCQVQIFYFSDLSAGKTASPLEGEYRLEDALSLLLENTGLTFRRVDASTVEITQRNPGAAPRKVAQARLRRSPETSEDAPEVTIQGTAQGLVATRIETPLREIPQSISVMSQEQIRQQNPLTLGDLLGFAGFSSVRSDSYFEQPYARGFGVTSYSLDGGGGLRRAAMPRFGPTLLLTPDPGNFDRVEVLRGSNALFGADGFPGAAINLVRKRPQGEFAAVLSATAGSWNNFRQQADVTGPLTDDGALRGRLVVSNASRDYFYKYANDERRSVYGVLDYELTTDTLLTLGGSYMKSRARPFEVGLPLFSDGTDSRLPRDTAFVFDWSRFDTRVAEVFLRVEQALGSTVRFNFQSTLLDDSATYAFGHTVPAISVATGRIAAPQGQYTRAPFSQRQGNVEATLSGEFQWAERGVQWVLGGDFLRSEYTNFTGVFGFGTPIDPWNFDPANYPYPVPDGVPPVSNLDNVTSVLGGLFGSMKIQILGPWSVMAGLRITDERDQSDGISYVSTTGTRSRRSYHYKGELTPFLGTLISLNPNWALYASYSDIFANTSGLVRSDQSALDPSDGITLEAGIKGTWHDGALNGSLAIYQTTRRHLAALDTTVRSSGLCCWTSTGKQESNGVELELSGHLTENWLIGTGYYFSDSKVIATNGSASPLVPYVPRHLLRLWTDYALPGAWRRWSIGGTLHGQSDITTSDRRATQESYAVVSPRIGYRFGEQQSQLALAVNNVFDRHYYESLARSTGSNWYGEPRSYQVRLDLRF